ncbi:alpha-galactosidase A-like [Stegodyphus dumicola]|uniref:alpha-galactosidase A-like n=1 Tax=Stegodyphus dumicola TaxID=202533 RepID=UPI0015AD5AF3|nr:alpha-galactosidase A-like [Stegodyphus dumicola]
MASTVFFLALLLPLVVDGLDNGLAMTPPMGWLSWERFTCNTDCKNDPANCISERLYMDMADRLVADGYKELGYEFVNIDDCWMEHERDTDGKLVPDRSRFPNGIKSLADYIHSKGLKLGIYQDIGSKTCAQYPGSYGYYEIDAATFAEWEVDMLKVDGCFADPKEMDDLYPIYSLAINKTGRSILFSCEWPFYQQAAGITPNYTQIATFCNTWRNFNDVDDSWQSILSIVDYYSKNQDTFVDVAGPGHWNDPDMILAGNSGLSYNEAKAQFMLWSVMASPLLMSNDLRHIRKEFSDLLKNIEIISVNQDSLGKMGKQIYSKSNIEIWMRPISPVSDNYKYSYAILFFNRNTLGGPQKVSVILSSIGLDNPHCYITYDVFNVKDKTVHCPKDTLTVSVNPSGATMIIAKSKNM